MNNKDKILLGVSCFMVLASSVYVVYRINKVNTIKRQLSKIM